MLYEELTCGSQGKESACSAGDQGSIPGSGRSPGEGNGYALTVFLPGESHEQRLQSMVSQRDMTEQLTLPCTCAGGFPDGSVVKNPPANSRDMGLEDPLEKEMATHSSVLAWEIPWTGAWGAMVHGVRKEPDTT